MNYGLYCNVIIDHNLSPNQMRILRVDSPVVHTSWFLVLRVKLDFARIFLELNRCSGVVTVYITKAGSRRL